MVNWCHAPLFFGMAKIKYKSLICECLICWYIFADQVLTNLPLQMRQWDQTSHLIFCLTVANPSFQNIKLLLSENDSEQAAIESLLEKILYDMLMGCIVGTETAWRSLTNYIKCSLQLSALIIYHSERDYSSQRALLLLMAEQHISLLIVNCNFFCHVVHEPVTINVIFRTKSESRHDAKTET